MKTTALLFLSLCLVAPSVPISAQEVLTNDAVVKMVRAGLPESVIVAKIRSSQTKFDVGTDALIALREAGVPDKVLEAIVMPPAQAVAPAPPVTPSASAPAPPPVTTTQPAASVPIQLPPGVVLPPHVLEALQRRGAQGTVTGTGTVYHVLGDRKIELTAVGAEIQTRRVPIIGSQTTELVLPGNKAGYRTAERQPNFLSTAAPSEMPLVRLKPGSDDRNLKFGSASTAPFVGTTHRQGVRAEDRIDVEAERDTQGFYRVRPRKALERGEYGFILTHGFVGAASKVYDFGVD